MKQPILKIHPPNPDRPIEMFQIWDHLLELCKDLGSYFRIPGLKIVFSESHDARWATCGIIHTSFDVQEYYHAESVYRYDVGQLLLPFAHLIANVRKPVVVLPKSVVSAISSAEEAEEMQDYATDVERPITGQWSVESVRKEFADLENLISMQREVVEYNTGLKSKAVFEKMFGQAATFDWESLKNFERDYPYMDSLFPGEKPRYRSACRNEYCGCEDSCCEVEIPPEDLDYELDDQWYAERIELGGPCAVSHARRYPKDNDRTIAAFAAPKID